MKSKFTERQIIVPQKRQAWFVVVAVFVAVMLLSGCDGTSTALGGHGVKPALEREGLMSLSIS